MGKKLMCAHKALEKWDGFLLAPKIEYKYKSKELHVYILDFSVYPDAH